ncbi:hypothetical protein ACLKA6_017618 [Drosophila palustris]
MVKCDQLPTPVTPAVCYPTSPHRKTFGVENAQRISLQRLQFVQAVPYGSHDTALGEFSAELRIDVASKIAENKVAFVQLLSRPCAVSPGFGRDIFKRFSERAKVAAVQKHILPKHREVRRDSYATVDSAAQCRLYFRQLLVPRRLVCSHMCTDRRYHRLIHDLHRSQRRRLWNRSEPDELRHVVKRNEDVRVAMP